MQIYSAWHVLSGIIYELPVIIQTHIAMISRRIM